MPGMDICDVDDAHDDVVDGLAEVAGHQPQGHAQGAGEEDAHDADDERGAGPDHEHAEHVPAQAVGPEGVGPASPVHERAGAAERSRCR